MASTVFAPSSSTAEGGAGEGDFSSTTIVGSFTSSAAVLVILGIVWGIEWQ
ncbi:uncharacterized protein G2W53_036665 [Senna tora]|uniref:Uncharacterized protein n=1 Tax=Senna tora TaxID=362788 RepID=A0A834SUE6_9FABA|nr:uncharacterized protein G2W53_036665 [Senna tora]